MTRSSKRVTRCIQSIQWGNDRDELCLWTGHFYRCHLSRDSKALYKKCRNCINMRNLVARILSSQRGVGLGWSEGKPWFRAPIVLCDLGEVMFHQKEKIHIFCGKTESIKLETCDGECPWDLTVVSPWMICLETNSCWEGSLGFVCTSAP